MCYDFELSTLLVRAWHLPRGGNFIRSRAAAVSFQRRRFLLCAGIVAAAPPHFAVLLYREHNSKPSRDCRCCCNCAATKQKETNMCHLHVGFDTRPTPIHSHSLSKQQFHPIDRHTHSLPASSSSLSLSPARRRRVLEVSHRRLLLGFYRTSASTDE